MKYSRKITLCIALALLVMYLGGWRIVLPSSDTNVKVLLALDARSYDPATKISDHLLANADLNVYIYETSVGNFLGLININEKNYGDFFMILALLVLAVPFGIFII